jgi:hypothetical protein
MHGDPFRAWKFIYNNTDYPEMVVPGLTLKHSWFLA